MNIYLKTIYPIEYIFILNSFRIIKINLFIILTFLRKKQANTYFLIYLHISQMHIIISLFSISLRLS